MKLLFSFLFTLLAMLINVYGEVKPVKNKTKYNFLITLPKSYTENSVKQPVLLFLHGRSLSGNNLERVKRYGVLYAMSKGQEIPAIVVAPQTNNGWNPDDVMEVIDYVLDNYNADPSRVYVCGMSMGGYGTLDVAGKYPERIAAAVAICGGGTLSYAENLTKVPLWIKHGSADRAVPMNESKKIYNAIKKHNPLSDVTLTIIKGGTHSSVERLFHQEDIYKWMFSYKKG